jgi:osmoprotectant transport system permease protein
VNPFQDALRYLNDPFNWTRPNGILDLLAEHLRISVFAVLAAVVIAVPLGMLLGHTGRGGGFIVALSNVSRAIPTLAMLTIFAVTPIGFGPRATTIALAVFAVPPILTNTYVGFRGVDRDVVEASRAMGMSGRQVMLRAELPLATPLLMTGVRTAAVQVVATATLAALVAGGGLGRIITLGFAQQDYGVVLAGAVLVALLAVLTEVVLTGVSWAVTPGQKRLNLVTSGRGALPPGDDGPAPIVEGDAGPVARAAPVGPGSAR